MWTKMGPVWLLNPPPPPPGPQIATDVNVFIWKTYYALLIVVVHLSPVWWGLHDTLVPLDSTYASPGPPKNGNKIMKNVHQITSIFYMLLRGYLWCEIYFKMCVGPWSMYIKCLWVLLTNVYWFTGTGGYICGCGRPSNLVSPHCPLRLVGPV